LTGDEEESDEDLEAEEKYFSGENEDIEKELKTLSREDVLDIIKDEL